MDKKTPADLRDAQLDHDRSSSKREAECVICLSPISERAVATPCNHLNFDFICLVTWLQEHTSCPLCKKEITAVEYDWRAADDFKTFVLDLKPQTTTGSRPVNAHIPRSHAQRLRPLNRSSKRQTGQISQTVHPNAAILRRRHVYRNQLYCLHVGTNRLSCFKDFTPQALSRDQELQSRARKWIRRELQVFDFLSDEGTVRITPPIPTQKRAASKRANNAEFLVSYILAILRTVDIKSSNGCAEELLQEFLGKENSRLFLHELQAWLRSPYSALEDWDRTVQYAQD